MASQEEMNNASIQSLMFQNAMKGKWLEVLKIYEKCRAAHCMKITKSGDTALHKAVSDGQEEIVLHLVLLISQNDRETRALRIKNEQQNTPLHLAASMGNVKMCKYIASADPSLVGDRNRDNETPLFLAALHGQRRAFLRLHEFCGNNGHRYYRGKDGDTILHVAISGDYFELAYDIIRLYKELLNSVNEQGFSPLHLLATKPSAFRSGSKLGRISTIIYNCICLDDELIKEETSDQEQPFKEEKDLKYPENYQTCVNFFRILRQVVCVGMLRNTPTQWDVENKNVQPSCENLEDMGEQSRRKARAHQLFPPNYRTCFDIIKFVSMAVLVVSGFAWTESLSKIRAEKIKNALAVKIMNEMLSHIRQYEAEDDGKCPFSTSTYVDPYRNPSTLVGGTVQPTFGEEVPLARKEKETTGLIISEKNTPILIAAKNGVIEMVEKILEFFPVAIHDMNDEKKNIVLLAVESRRPHVYNLLLEGNIPRESIFRQVDENGNSVLHLAAMLGNHSPWKISGVALQMQWELKWFEFVKSSLPHNLFMRYNKQGKTPEDIFTETHKDLIKSDGEWLTNSSQSCSVVAALIATVAFATSATVPGGFKENGIPIFQNEPAFKVFSIFSLIALSLSITSVVMFLSILMGRYKERDFGSNLPRKLLISLSSLFMSIAAMMISFCAGHFFMLKDELKYRAFPVYIATCLPATLFAVAHFPLYFDLMWATLKKVP